MEVAKREHIGNVRAVNEDSADVFYRDQMMLAIVADGLGGHQAGDVASQMAISKLKEKFERADLDKNVSMWEDWLLEMIQEANHSIYHSAQENPAHQGMGTTIVASLFLEEEYIIAHVGDSRLYRYVDQKLQLVTEDHSLVFELLRSGQLTKEEAENHPQRNVITRALGTEEDVQVDRKILTYTDQELVLLCSDGLTDMISEQQIEEILALEDSVEEKATLLLERALAAGGEDNLSFILVQIHGDRFESK